jgi:hypothetical protein
MDCVFWKTTASPLSTCRFQFRCRDGDQGANPTGRLQYRSTCRVPAGSSCLERTRDRTVLHASRCVRAGADGHGSSAYTQCYATNSVRAGIVRDCRRDSTWGHFVSIVVVNRMGRPPGESSRSRLKWLLAPIWPRLTPGRGPAHDGPKLGSPGSADHRLSPPCIAPQVLPTGSVAGMA